MGMTRVNPLISSKNNRLHASAFLKTKKRPPIREETQLLQPVREGILHPSLERMSLSWINAQINNSGRALKKDYRARLFL